MLQHPSMRNGNIGIWYHSIVSSVQSCLEPEVLCMYDKCFVDWIETPMLELTFGLRRRLILFVLF